MAVISFPGGPRADRIAQKAQRIIYAMGHADDHLWNKEEVAEALVASLLAGSRLAMYLFGVPHCDRTEELAASMGEEVLSRWAEMLGSIKAKQGG